MDWLDMQNQSFPLIIADPPDNLKLNYDGFDDNNPHYYDWIDLLIRKTLRVADCFWLSYYWKHDLEIKHRVRNILKHERPSVKAKTFIWRFTFGQYTSKDCGSGFRYLLRFTKPTAKFRPDAIREPSARMLIGDSRASGPRVPDDVWEFPRVVGNAAERRTWHPTQHPESLYSRICSLHSDRSDTVVDLFGGTGTLFRVRDNALICEISENYINEIKKEHNL